MSCAKLESPFSSGDPLATVEVNDPAVREHIDGHIRRANQSPNRAPAQGELGIVYETYGFIDNALVQYRTAQELDPAEPKWLYYDALLVAERLDKPLAISKMERVTEINPYYAPAFLWLGSWYLDTNALNDAADAYAVAQSLGSEIAALIGLARVAHRRGDPTKAIAILEPLAAEHDLPYAYQLLGFAHIAAGNPEEAKALLTKYNAHKPIRWSDPWREEKDDFEVASLGTALARAQLAMDEGQWTEAQSKLLALRDAYPANRRVIHNLVLVERALGNDDAAFLLLSNAAEDHPDYYPFLFLLGKQLQARNELNAALRTFEQAIALDASLYTAHMHRGEVLLRLSRLQDAQLAFRHALQRFQHDPTLYVLHGVVNRRLGNLILATRSFRDAIELEPAFAPAYGHLALALAQQGEIQMAEETLRAGQAVGIPSEQVETIAKQIAALRE